MTRARKNRGSRLGTIGGVFLAATFVAGCSIPTEQVQLEESTTPPATTITYTASTRGAYLVPGDSETKFCAEPAPDVALNTLENVTGGAQVGLPTTGSVDASAALKLQSDVVQLTGRTQLVLLAREMLFRACELLINEPDIGPDVAQKMYDEVVQLVRDLALAEKIDSLTALANATEGSANVNDLLRQFDTQPPDNTPRQD